MSVYLRSMSKTITVDITVGKTGRVYFDFMEPESGDTYTIHTTLDNLGEEQDRVGSELLSWVSLMADELDEEGNDE